MSAVDDRQRKDWEDWQKRASQSPMFEMVCLNGTCNYRTMIGPTNSVTTRTKCPLCGSPCTGHRVS